MTKISTTDQALALAVEALEKIKRGEGTAVVVAVTALANIPKPEELLSVQALAAPLCKSKKSWDHSSQTRHAFLSRLSGARCPK